ncbi:MAG: GGDEF domain-containing protein [Acidiferrobacterales bacterium]
MSVSELVSADPTLVQTIRRHLAGLKRNDAGSGLFRLLQYGLDKCSAVDGPIDYSGVVYLHAKLGAYASDGSNLPALRIKARVIQQHLAPYLHPDVKDSAASNPFQPYIDAINRIGGGSPLAPAACTRIDQSTDQPDPAVACTRNDAMPVPPEAGIADGSGTGGNNDDGLDYLEKVLVADDQDGTSEKRYQALRKSELDAWRAIYGTIKDFKSLKRLWVGSLDELLRERMELERQLGNASDHIKSVESERDSLRVELDQARSRRAGRQSATTRIGTKRGKRTGGLARRETFVQQLEAEIERARRYGSPLALALIGIEGLDEVSACHGEDAEKHILACYTGEILANFRTYDLVAHYDAHQFAVLFPGTDRDGAVRALVKAQKRAADTHLNLARECFALPRFYGALGMHSAGEDAATLMARTCAMLEEARTAPPPHVVVASQRLALVRPDTWNESRSGSPNPGTRQ